MKKIGLLLMAAACVIGRPGAAPAAETYASCVRDYVSQCQYVRDEWENCSDASLDIRDMCRSLYPAPAKKKPHH